MEKSLFKKIKENSQNLSEIGTIYHLIMPIFDNLGWKNIENVVFEEATSTQKRVDLKFISNKNIFFLEAKKFGTKLTDKDFEQLTNYINSDVNCNFGILTNGHDYWIADNKKEGLDDKKIHTFSIPYLTNCDLAILEFFKFPLEKLDDLNEFLDFQRAKIKFENFKCEKLFEENSEVEKVVEVLEIEDFWKLKNEDFENFVKYFVKKVELAIEFLEKENRDLGKFFETFSGVFKREKPKYTYKFLGKYNIYLSTNSNTKNKENTLEKIESYLNEISYR
jgi:predicted type IV restriction endonuclease